MVASSSSSFPTTTGTSVAILVSRQKANAVSSSGTGGADGQDGTVQLAVWVHVPRCRSSNAGPTITSSATAAADNGNVDDNVTNHRGPSSTLTYYDFFDHVRSFSNLDALLTQLERPLSVIHIACTEKAEVSHVVFLVVGL